MGANLKICWRFYTIALRQKLTRSRCTGAASSMAFLSVGLKIHYLGSGSELFSLVERLGGASRVLEINGYKHAQASLCLVLPPVGNARSAILLLECIERFITSSLFGNPKIQIQVCSPGRLDA